MRLARLCHKLGKTVPQAWQDCAIGMAMLCQCGGKNKGINAGKTPLQAGQIHIGTNKSPSISVVVNNHTPKLQAITNLFVTLQSGKD